MRYTRLLPLAALAVAAACNDAGQDTASPLGPSFKPSGAAAHYIASATSAALSPSPDLLISFKIAGLGSGVTVAVTGTATANLVAACVNGGDNQPSDKKKHLETHPVSVTEEFTADGGGNIQDSELLEFPASSLSCPGGQTATVFTRSWTDISVSTPSPSGGSPLEFNFGDITVQ